MEGRFHFQVEGKRRDVGKIRVGSGEASGRRGGKTRARRGGGVSE